MSDRAVMPLSDYVSACDTIREKTETTDLIKSGELSEKIDDVYEAGKNATWDALKKTISGTDIVRIDDISPIKHEMSVKVQSKNLYNIPDCEVTTVTKNGVTADVMEDGQLHVYGTVTDTSNYTILQFPIQYTKRKTYPAGTFIGWRLNGNGNQIYTQFGLRNSAGTILNIQQGAKTTTESRTLEYMTVIVSPNYTESIDLIVPTQLEYGTTATEYAPYIPDISAVKVSKLGKNLCDNVFEVGGIHSDTGQDMTQGDTIRSVNYYPIKPNTTYTIKAFNFTDNIRFRFYDKDKNYVGYKYTVIVNGEARTFTATNDSYFVRFDIFSGDTNTGRLLQLELGENATEYEPYIQPTEYTLDAEGIVQGVTSLYPCTMLMSDTDGVIIETTYNQELSEVDDIPESIEDIYVEGQMVGHTQGEREMWGYILNYGEKYDFNKAFSQTGFEYIRPPYKIVPTSNYSLNQTFIDAKKLKKVEAAYFDFSKKQRGTFASTGLYWTFGSCFALEEVEDIGLQPDYSLSGTFAYSGIKRIAMLRVDEQTKYDDAFEGCTKLEEVRFEGDIGQNGLDFSPCIRLDSPSTHNIFTHLKDFREVVVDNYIYVYDWNTPTQLLGSHTLVAGAEYCLYFSDVGYGTYSGKATAETINVPNVGNVLGLKYDFSHPAGDEYVLTKYIYQSGDNIVLYENENGSTETIVTLTKAPTETRTITMPKALKDNGNATPEDIAEATDRGWTIAWKE